MCLQRPRPLLEGFGELGEAEREREPENTPIVAMVWVCVLHSTASAKRGFAARPLLMAAQLTFRLPRGELNQPWAAGIKAPVARQPSG